MTTKKTHTQKKMFIATCCVYDSSVHGVNGPDGHFIVDNVWTPDEFARNEPIRRATRHHLNVEIVRLTETGDYSTCVLCTVYLRILQRVFRRWN